MLGVISDISCDGPIAIVKVHKPGGWKPARFLYAESRLLANAIEDAFGDNWRGQLISYHADDCGMMTDFMPAGGYEA